MPKAPDSHPGVRSSSTESIVSVQSQKIDVPEDVKPALSRIQSRDILNYLESQNSKNKEQEEKQYWQTSVKNLFKTSFFEIFMGGVILINMIVMIVETNRIAQDGEEARDEWHWTELFGWLVLIIFVLELTARLIVFRMEFWTDAWNVFDFTIVSIDTAFSLVSLFFGHIFPVSVLRVFRLAKLARAFKVLRVFPELRLLLAGLFSSVSAIFWGTLLLFFCMLMWAMVAVLFIHPLNKTIDYDLYGGCYRCPYAYSTVMHAVMTFWQSIVTGDSWGSATIPVIEKYPSTAAFFVAVYLSVGMAVTNLILGVVVNVAQQAVSKLSAEDDAQAAVEKLGKSTHLVELCQQMDTDQSGDLSQDEVYAAFDKDNEFRETMMALDIERGDLDIVWTILDEDRNGIVSYRELIGKLASMKASDSSFMLSYIKYYITLLKTALLDRLDRQHLEAMEIEHEIEEKFEHNMQILEAQEEDILEDTHMILEEVGCRKEPDVPRNEELTQEIPQGSTKFMMTPVASPCTSNVGSINQGDAAQMELDHLRNVIASMQKELKGILNETDRKLGKQDLRMAAINVDVTNMKDQSGLIALPANDAHRKANVQSQERRAHAASPLTTSRGGASLGAAAEAANAIDYQQKRRETWV